MSQRLSREEFHRWAEGQTGRYERIDGKPVAMSPERIQHVRIKSRIWAALNRAIIAAGLDCEALHGWLRSMKRAQAQGQSVFGAAPAH